VRTCRPDVWLADSLLAALTAPPRDTAPVSCLTGEAAPKRSAAIGSGLLSIRARLTTIVAFGVVFFSACNPPPPSPVRVCGTSLCAGSHTWSMYGVLVYNPRLTPYRSGIKNPSGTVALVGNAHLNTGRLTNSPSHTGNPAMAPYDLTARGDSTR
jgi:hypothetical protein